MTPKQRAQLAHDSDCTTTVKGEGAYEIVLKHCSGLEVKHTGRGKCRDLYDEALGKLQAALDNPPKAKAPAKPEPAAEPHNGDEAKA